MRTNFCVERTKNKRLASKCSKEYSCSKEPYNTVQDSITSPPLQSFAKVDPRLLTHFPCSGGFKYIQVAAPKISRQACVIIKENRDQDIDAERERGNALAARGVRSLNMDGDCRISKDEMRGCWDRRQSTDSHLHCQYYVILEGRVPLFVSANNSGTPISSLSSPAGQALARDFLRPIFGFDPQDFDPRTRKLRAARRISSPWPGSAKLRPVCPSSHRVGECCTWALLGHQSILRGWRLCTCTGSL
jgi:hypothetical protein